MSICLCPYIYVCVHEGLSKFPVFCTVQVHYTTSGHGVARTNGDAYFVLSLEAKVNNDKHRVSVVYTEQNRRDYRYTEFTCFYLPHFRTDASTMVLIMLLPDRKEHATAFYRVAVIEGDGKSTIPAMKLFIPTF